MTSVVTAGTIFDSAGTTPYLELPFSKRGRGMILELVGTHGFFVLTAGSGFGKTFLSNRLHRQLTPDKVPGTPTRAPIGLTVIAGSHAPRHFLRPLMASIGQGQFGRAHRLNVADAAGALARAGTGLIIAQQAQNLSPIECTHLVTLHEECVHQWNHDFTLVLMGTALPVLYGISRSDGFARQIQNRVLDARAIPGHQGQEIAEALRLFVGAWDPELERYDLPSHAEEIEATLIRHHRADPGGLGARVLELFVCEAKNVGDARPAAQVSEVIELAVRVMAQRKANAGEPPQ